jgi:16S rRNA processing protein RimM
VDTSAWIAVGRLLRTRGRVGEFVAEIDSSQPGRAGRLRRVALRKPGREGLFEVAGVWYHAGRPVLRFHGIETISEAEPWEGAEILVPPEERVRPEPGEYLHADLIGCTVEEHGVELGQVDGVEQYGGPALLRVRDGSGRELLIPFARAYLRGIDLAAKRILVELPEGLREL